MTPAEQITVRPPRRGPGRRGPVESLLSRTLAMVFLVAITAYFLVPIYWLIVSSTKSQGSLTSTFGLWFGDFNLVENLRDVLTRDNGIFVRWAVNSLVYAGLGALIGTLISTMTGYALAKFVFPGRRLMFDVVLGGILVPTTALALPLFLLFARLGLTNTYWSVLLPSVVSPFGVYLAKIFAQSAVPDELLEAARLDGAGEFRAFFTIVTRLMVPSMVTIFLLQFVGIWNNFFLPRVMLQSSEMYPITLGLYNWNFMIDRHPLLQIAVITGSMLSVVPLIAVFLSLQRFWRTGLAAGSLR